MTPAALSLKMDDAVPGSLSCPAGERAITVALTVDLDLWTTLSTFSLK